MELDLVEILEVLEATAISIRYRGLTGKHINRESRLDTLVDLGLVDWKEASDGSHEMYVINAKGRAALARFRHSLEM
jgi:hypothetical protein